MTTEATAHLVPGEECPTCNRKVPHVHQKEPGPKQARFTVLEPGPEAGTLDDLLCQLVEKFQDVWPEDLGRLGDKGWRYRALHFGLYALVTAPHDVAVRLIPSEEGS